ncbi:hypothetical protein [Roseovarius sp.]|nr:hypothetical protein [Roseovarius sp.]
MPTPYFAPDGCSLAPHIALEWIGAPCEAVKAPHGGNEPVPMNPAGAVPSLREDDGWLLAQAGAILGCQAPKYPEADLHALSLQDRKK